MSLKSFESWDHAFAWMKAKLPFTYKAPMAYRGTVIWPYGPHGRKYRNDYRYRVMSSIRKLARIFPAQGADADPFNIDSKHLDRCFYEAKDETPAMKRFREHEEWESEPKSTRSHGHGGTAATCDYCGRRVHPSHLTTDAKTRMKVCPGCEKHIVRVRATPLRDPVKASKEIWWWTHRFRQGSRWITAPVRVIRLGDFSTVLGLVGKWKGQAFTVVRSELTPYPDKRAKIAFQGKRYLAEWAAQSYADRTPRAMVMGNYHDRGTRETRNDPSPRRRTTRARARARARSR